MASQTKLFDQFPPVTTKEWMDKITADLKGADFSKKLVWKTNEGFDVRPFYRREDIPAIGTGAIRKTCNWLVRQDITVTDYMAANRKALSILMKGIDSLGFIIHDPESVNEENFKILLDGINPECVELNFRSAGKAKEIVTLLAKISESNGFDLLKITGAIEADPLGRLMINGTLCIPVEAGLDYLASLTAAAKILPQYRNIQVNGLNFANSGSDVVQELGYSMAMAAEYLARLTERGLDPEEVAKRIRFSFGAGSVYFMEIAKLRAARILWKTIANGYQSAAKNPWRMEIHSTTGKWNMTVYDPYVNMLRTQTAAMSAILGGTDSLTVTPFDSAFRDAGEFSERIARNQQLILKEEAYFDKVADPSSGSYYIENLTALVAEHSWKLFLEIEENGGFLSALRSGFIQKKISETASKRKNDIARRKEILTGTNQYPQPHERVAAETETAFSPGESC